MAAAWLPGLAAIDGFLVPFLRGSHVITEGADPIEFTIEVTLGAELRTLRIRPAGGLAGATDDASTTESATNEEGS